MVSLFDIIEWLIERHKGCTQLKSDSLGIFLFNFITCSFSGCGIRVETFIQMSITLWIMYVCAFVTRFGDTGGDFVRLAGMWGGKNPREIL